MQKNIFFLCIVTNLLFPQIVWGNDDQLLQKGRVDSPYQSCQKQILVERDKFNNHSDFWKDYEIKCKTKVQVVTEAGFSKIDPLKEGAEYLIFAQKVAQKIDNNLDISKAYAECSAQCFEGAVKCNEGVKEILCSTRREEVLNKLTVDSRRARIELALSSDAPGLISVNIRNVLNVDKDKFINSNLRDFEVGIPNPVGRNQLTPRELNEARRRVEHDRQKLDNEFKEKGHKNYQDWMSVKLMEKFDEHKARYRSIIYQESPLLAVIDRPQKFEDGSEPVWSNRNIAEAFKKLSINAQKTKEKVKWSIDKGKLEFSRIDGEAIGRWLSSLAPGAKDQSELLYYVGLKNPVEAVLKDNPEYCAIATSMEKRFQSKEVQNTVMSFAGSVASAGVIKGASSITGNVFRLGRALSGTEAIGLTGIAMGSSNLADSFSEYGSIKKEVLSGAGVREALELTDARERVKNSLILSPIDGLAAVKLTKTAFKIKKELLDPKIQQQLLKGNYQKTKTLHSDDEKLMEQCSITNKISSSDKLQCLSFLDAMLKKNLIKRVENNFTLTRVSDYPSKRDIPKMLQEEFTFRDGSTIKTRDIILGGKLKDSLGRTWRVVEVNNVDKSFKLEGNGVIKYNNFLREEFGSFHEYNLRVDGTDEDIKIFLPETDEKTLLKLHSVLQEIIKQTPKGYFDYSKEFIFANSPGATQKSAFFVNGLFSKLTHQIWIYPRTSLKEDFSEVAQTFWHEQGHAYFANIINQNGFANKWIQAINKDGRFVTEYAKTNFEEDFCETIAHYILYDGGVKKNKLRSQFKARFEVLDEIFNANPEIKKKLAQVLFIKRLAGGGAILGAGSAMYFYENE